MKKIQTKNIPVSELQDMLSKKLAEAKKNILELHGGRIKNTRSFFNQRKDIARIKTALRQAK